jgi:hypothetical protein
MKYARRLFGRPEYAKHMSKGASVLKSANVLLFMGMTFDHNETPNSTFNSAASYSTTALAVPLLSVAATTSGILQVLQYRKEMKKERERFDSYKALVESLDIMMLKGGGQDVAADASQKSKDGTKANVKQQGIYTDFVKAIEWLKIYADRYLNTEVPTVGSDNNNGSAQSSTEAPAKEAQDDGDDSGEQNVQPATEAPAKEAQDGGDDSGGSAQKQSKGQSEGTKGISDNKRVRVRELDLEEIYRAAALLEELYDQELVHGGQLIFEIPELVESTTVRNVSASHAEKSDDGDNSNKQKPSPLQPILDHLEQRGLREKYEDILKFVYRPGP